MRIESPAGKRRSFARSAFIVLQIAGSTLLLTASLLFVRSFWTSSTADPGFEANHLVVLELKPTDYGYDAVRSRAFLDSLLDRVKSSPGVTRAAVADRIPFYVGFPKTARVSSDGSDCAVVECRPTNVYSVGAEHFAALGVPLIAGRDFNDRDIAARDSAIVAQTMAARLWPGRDAVGQWIRLGATGQQLQVIGVAADVTHHMFNERPADYVYRAIEPEEFGDRVTMIVRTDSDAAAFVGQLQEHIRALDPALPPGAIKTMTQRMEMPLWPVRTAAGFFTICGLLALVLATVGLFGTTYLTVGQRTREFGIRAALGSTRVRVMRLVLGEGLLLAVPGILAGIAGAALAARMVSSVIVTVDAADASTYAVVALLQAMAAIGACLWPAHRATKADPILALRAE
jgi:predicted permease